MEVKFSSLAELKAQIEKAIKTNGYFFKTDKPLPIRTTLTLSLSVEGYPKTFSLQAEVVFAGSGGIGVTFIESGESIKKKYEEFMKAQGADEVKLKEPSSVVTPEIPPVQARMIEPTVASVEKTEPARSDDEEVVSNEPSKTINVIRGKMVNTLKIETGKSSGFKDKLANFGDMSFAKILINLFEGKCSGMITLKLENQEKKIYLRGGRPVFVESIPPLADESLGQILLTKGKIKKEDLDRALKMVEEQGIRIGEALQQMRIVSTTLLKDALTFQLKMKLYDVFKWKEADFEMQLMSNMPHKFGTRPINAITVIYKGLKEKLKELYPADLEKYISPIYDKYLTQKESKLFDLENLGFNPNERRFWDLMLNGKRRVREIFAGSTLNKPDTFRFLYALIELDLININDERTLDIPNIERDIYNEMRYTEKMDYFEMLCLHWSANKEKVELAYNNKVKECEDRKRIPDLSQDTIANLNKIIGFYRQAYEELSVDAKRREYRKQILGESEAKIAAELAAKQAQLMELRNDIKEARSLMEVAMDLNPTSSEYRALYRRYGGR